MNTSVVDDKFMLRSQRSVSTHGVSQYVADTPAKREAKRREEEEPVANDAAHN